MLANATVADALLAIARLGGHIKKNGAPGWIVLMRTSHLADVPAPYPSASEIGHVSAYPDLRAVRA